MELHWQKLKKVFNKKKKFSVEVLFHEIIVLELKSFWKKAVESFELSTAVAKYVMLDDENKAFTSI